ncbi:MAG: hypothetical protein GM46_8410 [actinobacterium acAcidi]|nr:MAG: hypothetical protein GM46_8410 [actinobacterium acAcidi]
MAWDSTRTVNWARLIREWIVYAVVMSGVFVIFLRDNVSAGSIAGLAASFPMYLIFGGALAKFGYQRKTLTDLRRETPVRTPRASRRSRGATSQESTPTKDRPAPTSRTTTGPSQHRSNKRKKR